MSMVAFPVHQTADGIGCTDIMMRTIYGALYPDKGIITGLGVTGGNTTAYTVAAGVAVCSKGSADGTVLAPYEGGTVSVSANSASNPRIDVVWICHHDVTQGDEDNYVTLGVTEGAAAASPVEPDIPSYATKLQAMTMPANATTTASATKSGTADMAIPYGASLGLIGKVLQSHNGDWGTPGTYTRMAQTSFTLPTARTVQLNVTITAGATSGTYTDGDGSVYSRVDIDGTSVDGREIRLRAKGNAISQFYQVTTTLQAGKHNLEWFMSPNACKHIYMYCNLPGWAGQQIQVVDLGPVD